MRWQAGQIRPIIALTVGHVTHDRYDGRLLAGGCAYYGARTMHALGAQSRLVTCIGGDFACQAELDELDVACAVGLETTTFTNQYAPDGSRLQCVEDQAPPVTPALLPSDWRRPDVAFIAPVCNELALGDWLGVIEAPVIGVGLQGLLKQRGEPSRSGRHSVIRRALELERTSWQRVSAAFVSDEDIQQLADAELIAALRAIVPLLVVTFGKAGCEIQRRGEHVRLGALPVNSCDPTGAGDTFAAAFLFALAQKASPVDAGKLATAAASAVVQARGGEYLPRVRDAYQRADEVPVLIEVHATAGQRR
jgi:hypothetical protein